MARRDRDGLLHGRVRYRHRVRGGRVVPGVVFCDRVGSFCDRKGLEGRVPGGARVAVEVEVGAGRGIG